MTPGPPKTRSPTGPLSTLRQYLILGRVHSAIMLGMAAIFGALAAGGGGFLDLAVLFAIGLCTHIYGFGLNELEDVEVDRASADLSGKPLVSGTVSPTGARAFVFGGLALSYALLLWFATSFEVLLLLYALHSVSIAAITTYDKRGKVIPGADFLLSVCVLMLPLIGAIAVGGDPLAPLVLVVAGCAYIQGVVQNIIAGLKDADHDSSAGAKTTVLRLGAKVVPRGGSSRGGRIELVPGAGVTALILSLKAAQLVLAGLPWFMGWLDYLRPEWLLLLAMMGLQLAAAVAVLFPQPFHRDNIKRRVGLHEMVTYITVPVIFIPLLGSWQSSFWALFPILWLAAFLMMQYGRLMPDI